jgi:fibronectin-binding autotransporter adhesin
MMNRRSRCSLVAFNFISSFGRARSSAVRGTVPFCSADHPWRMVPVVAMVPATKGDSPRHGGCSTRPSRAIRSQFLAALAISLGLLLMAERPQSASAQTWNGGGADGNWNTAGNWTGGVPSNNGTANVFFGGTVHLSPIVNTNNPWSINSITFNSLAAANAFSISGNALTIGTGGITNNDNDFETFGNNITTNGSQIWSASGNGLQFNGNVTIASGNTLTLTSAGNNIGLSGAVSGGNGLIASGTGGLFISGLTDNTGLALAANSGTVTLTKSSSASVHAIGSGGLTIAGATVKLVSGLGGDQILDTAPVTINSGSLDLNSASETIGALNGLAAGIITNSISPSTSTLTVSGGGTFAGVIKNGGPLAFTDLTVGGSTPLILTGANTANGATTINNGATLQLGNSAASGGTVGGVINDNGTLIFANSQFFGNSIFGTGSLTKTGTGTLTLLSGTQSGGTTINGGTLAIPNGGALTSQGIINVGTSGIAGQNGTLTVDGTGTVLQTSNNFVEVGSFGATTGTLNIGTTLNGATFTVGTGGIGIQSGSSVNIGSGAVTGTVTSNGGVFVNGGVVQTANSGSVFSLAAGQTLNVNAGGRASFTGNFSTNSGGSYVVSGAGSKLETLAGGNLTVTSGATVNVSSGGLLSSAGQFGVGINSGNGTVVVDGAGSKLTASSFTSIALTGFTGSVTLQNGSAGNTFSEIDIAQSSVDGSMGSMSVLSGSTATIGNLNLLFSINSFSNVGQSAAFTVDGAGSSVTLTPGANVSVGQDSPNLAALTVSNNGTFTVGTGGTTTLNATGTINVAGGSADLKTLVRNGGTLNFTSGSLSFLGSFTVGVGGLLGPGLILDPSKILTLNGTTTIDQFRTLTLSGGTLNTGSLVINGTLLFNSGTLGITGASGLTIGSGGPLGSTFELGSGRTLNVTNATTVNSGALLVLDSGGAFTSGSLINNGEIDLDGLTAVAAGGTVSNSGLIRGEGRFASSVTNNAGGEIRAESGKRIKLAGTNGPDTGNINLQGGTAEFSQPLTIATTGQINGQGNLIVATGSNTGIGATQTSVFGLADNGTIQFSGGDTNIYGSVNLPGTYNGGGTFTGPGTGKLLIGAGANTVSFYGDVWNNAALFRTAAGSYAVFFGTVHGASSFSGGGTVDFEGTYLAGNSPAVVGIGGNAVFGVADTLDINLGGTTPGNGANNYAQVNVTASANLSGTLNLIPYNGFVPVSGDKFTVMTYANETGTFSSLTGTSPAPGLTYTAVYLPTSLVIVTTTNGDKTWGVDASGNASVGSNWLGGVAPGGIGDSAAFTTIITANRTVTLDADTTVGTLKFDSPNNYLIAGPHTLTLQAAGSTAAAINVSGAHGNGAQTISAPVTLASDLNVTQNSGGVFTISGPLNNAAGHNAIAISGTGTTAITGSVNLGNATALSASATATLRFGLTSGTATIGTGVTAVVNNGATLELAGSVSALSSATNRVNITNNSNAAAGVLVSGANQQVGNIDGPGNVQINAGASLTANHITAGALVIGGTAGSAATLTIDASDALGNPLGQSSGLALAGSLQSTAPFTAGAPSSSSLDPPSAEDFSGDPIPAGPGADPTAVPEPSTLLLALVALVGAAMMTRGQVARASA